MPYSQQNRIKNHPVLKEKESVVVNFTFDDSDGICSTILHQKIVKSGIFLDLINIKSITKNVYLKRDITLFQESYLVNLENIELEHYFYSKLPTGEYKIKDELDLNEEEQALYEKLDEDVLNKKGELHPNVKPVTADELDSIY